MKKREFITIISVLIVLNIWQVYSNNQKNKVIEELVTKNSLSSNWSFETVDSTFLYLSHDEVEVSKVPLSLIVLFSDQGCQSCIEDEVSLLNNFDKKKPNTFEAYLLTQKAPTYLSRMFEVDFGYQVIDPRIDIFDVDFEFVNPIAVLVDSTGLVHRIHKAEVGNKNKSEEFYRQMEGLFSK